MPTETVVEQPITGGTQTNVGPILAEKTSRNPTRLATVSREFSFSTIFGRALLKARESAQNRTEQNTIPYSVPYYNYTTKEPRTPVLIIQPPVSCHRQGEAEPTACAAAAGLGTPVPLHGSGGSWAEEGCQKGLLKSRCQGLGFRV